MPTVIPATGARYFSKGFNDQKAAPAFQYLFDSGVVWQNDAGMLVTGAMRPVVPTDLASTSNVSVSGLSLTVGAVAITGNPLVTVSNTILPTSGTVQGGNNLPLYVTGIIQTVVTGSVGGNVTVSSVAITGFSPTIAPQAVSGFFTPIWTGSPNVTAAVTIGNVAITGYNSTIAPLAVSGFAQVTNNLAISGGYININSASQELALLSGISGSLTSNLSTPAWVTGQIIDTVTGWNTGIVVAIQPVTKTTVSTSAPSGVSPWTSMSSVTTGLIGTNPNRVMFFIQTIHTGIPTYVALNSNPASTGNFNFILNPSLVQGYGGSSFSDDHYRGPVQISGGAYIAWEV